MSTDYTVYKINIIEKNLIQNNKGIVALEFQKDKGKIFYVVVTLCCHVDCKLSCNHRRFKLSKQKNYTQLNTTGTELILWLSVNVIVYLVDKQSAIHKDKLRFILTMPSIVH